jgi:hypothetical protein
VFEEALLGMIRSNKTKQKLGLRTSSSTFQLTPSTLTELPSWPPAAESRRSTVRPSTALSTSRRKAWSGTVDCERSVASSVGRRPSWIVLPRRRWSVTALTGRQGTMRDASAGVPINVCRRVRMKVGMACTPGSKTLGRDKRASEGKLARNGQKSLGSVSSSTASERRDFGAAPITSAENRGTVSERSWVVTVSASRRVGAVGAESSRTSGASCAARVVIRRRMMCAMCGGMERRSSEP